jgi:hypothetical protein
MPTSVITAAPNSAVHSRGFWARQFAVGSTPGQRVFDVGFGLLAPAFCLIFDPAVFRTDSPFPIGDLHRFRLFAYLEIALGVVAFGYFLLFRRPSAALAGILSAGALFSALVGILILPLSLIGLLVLIGIFGFVPFLSAFVLWRNACRCKKRLVAQQPAAGVRARLALTAVVALAIPAGVQFTASRMATEAMRRVVGNSETDPAAQIRILQRIRIAAETDDLVEAYQKTGDLGERARLASIFKQITGQRIDSRIAERAD